MGRHSAHVEYRKNRIWTGAIIASAAVLIALLPIAIGRTDATAGKGMAVASASKSGETITNSIPGESSSSIDRASPRSPLPPGTPEASGGPDDPTPTPTPTVTPKMINYTVVAGDTLSSIAAKFKIAGYTPLYQWNLTVVGQDPNLIHPGLVLVVAVS